MRSGTCRCFPGIGPRLVSVVFARFFFANAFTLRSCGAETEADTLPQAGALATNRGAPVANCGALAEPRKDHVNACAGKSVWLRASFASGPAP